MFYRKVQPRQSPVTTLVSSCCLDVGSIMAQEKQCLVFVLRSHVHSALNLPALVLPGERQSVHKKKP